MEEDSDTGFSSKSCSEDEIVELNNKGIKRKSSESDAELNKKSKKKIKKLKKENQLKKFQKLPTANELNRLRETENLFHSNLFRLQIEEMLKEVQFKEKLKVDLDLWYEKFSDWIMKVEDNNSKYEINDQQWLKQFNIKVPISQIPYLVKGNYQFKKPSGVSLIGSYATNTVIGPRFNVDVLVEVPNNFYQKEDYLNTRYHKKRSLYLCELVHHIQLLPNLVEDIVFVAEEIDTLKPKVEITPFGKLSKYVKFILHLGAEKGTFKLQRLTPSYNNVRNNWYFRDNTNKQENIPTPFYNSSIAFDLTLQENMKFLIETISPHSNIKDGIILLKIWLRQRELHDSIGGFNGFIVSMVVCYLIKIKKVNLLMSSYQVFRNTCHYLTECDWTTNGISLCDFEEHKNMPGISEYHKNYKVVFVDVTGFYNLCYAMSPSLFRKVQHEAELALKWLNDPNVNSFQVLFITKVPFYQHYDHVVLFNNGELLENIADVYCTKETQLSHCGIIFPLVRESIISVLNQGFGKRVKFLNTKLPEKNRWKITKKPRWKLTLIVGFNLDPENYFSIVDKALETETDAEAFQCFWGEKSELRRFQDGSITEAVVWSGRTISEKRLICKEILTYLLKLKFGLDSTDFQYVADQLDSHISKNVEENSLTVIETFEELARQLRNLNDLPLNIVSVQGVSPVFRYAEVFPPIPQKQRNIMAQKKNTNRNYSCISTILNSCPPWINPVDVTIQLETSNKWPQDLAAIKRLLAAFNIKISDLLISQHGLVCIPFQDKIEVVKKGFVFRLKVVYPNEIPLLKQTIDSDGLIKYKDTEKSLALEKQTVFLPKLSSILHGISQAYNSFGPACCLVKRWISSHLIDGYHMSEESIELLVASLYLRPQPHEPPVQPQVALFRFFQLITTTNWNSDCIVLNINNELTREEVIEIELEFNNNRSTLPPVFIATPYDRTKSVWTKDSPTSLILLRLIELSANALQVVETQIYSKALSEIKILFEPCLDSYDIIITLDENYNAKKNLKAQKDTEQFENFIQKIPINDFNPVDLYLKDLREAYNEFALFFYDYYKGSTVAVKWKPNALEFNDFKVVKLPAHTYDNKIKKLVLNKESIIEDFWIIGKNLVKYIDVRENDELKRFECFL